MTIKAAGRRFVRELRRNHRSRQEAHQTIAIMDGGWWGGMVGDPLTCQAVTGPTRRSVEQQIDRFYDAAIFARVLRRAPAVRRDRPPK